MQKQKIMTGVAALLLLGCGAWAQEVKKSWADNVTINGDVRYRHESINDDSKLDADHETYTRQRDRIRARIGADAKLGDDLKAGIQFSTGQSDPVSGNQTLGDGLGKKDMKLNLAYFDWTLFNNDPNTVNLVGGKMKNPFINLSGDFIWDPDLTPEGLAVKSQVGGDTLALLGNAGYMWIKERSAGGDDTMLYGGQAAVRFAPVPELSLTVGGTYYTYDNIQGYDVIDWDTANKGGSAYGNSTINGTVSGGVTNKAWKTEFAPVEFFAEAVVYIMNRPVKLYAQTVQNEDADDLNRGFVYGSSIGKAKNPKTAEVGYAYCKLEKDAVVGAFTDSDRWGGGTDGKGHKVYGKYQITKNLQAGVTYFVDDKTISDSSKTKDYDRLQVDLIAAF